MVQRIPVIKVSGRLVLILIRKYGQIARVVVQLIAIVVMNNLLGFQLPTEILLGHPSVV
jgi:hypothetical protein